MAARDRVLIEPRDHHPAPVEQGTSGVNRLGRVRLAAELDNAVKLAGKDLPILLEHADQYGKTHRDWRQFRRPCHVDDNSDSRLGQGTPAWKTLTY